ncbi:MAG: cobalamin biosynthesis protein CbiG [Pseudomonadota bacterium]
MPLFDAYVMTDWSAASSPTRPRAPNTIWSAWFDTSGLVIENFTTRMAAMAWLTERFAAEIAQGRRVLAGFDFSFGYPAGAAAAITGAASWQALWSFLAEHVGDDEQNANNRFAVADALNRDVFAEEPKFWGRPPHRADLTSLPAKKSVIYGAIAEHRLAEGHFTRAQPVWKMFTTGSVGGQSMMGIKHLEALRCAPGLKDIIRVWPFETSFDQDLPGAPSVVVCELYPSAFPVDAREGEVIDQAQVRSVVEYLVSADLAGELRPLLAAPPGSSPAGQALMLAEEGSIMGAGRL